MYHSVHRYRKLDSANTGSLITGGSPTGIVLVFGAVKLVFKQLCLNLPLLLSLVCRLQLSTTLTLYWLLDGPGYELCLNCDVQVLFFCSFHWFCTPAKLSALLESICLFWSGEG